MRIISILIFLTVLFQPNPVGFNYPVWQKTLNEYHDAEYVWQGINDGFDIGWIDGAQPDYVDVPQLSSDKDEQLDITKWLVKRHASGVLLGPFAEDNCPVDGVRVSPLFTVPKPDFTRRTVAHLSYPKNGISINDCIDEAAKAVSYISFVEVAKFVYDLGYDARLWVVDAKDAYYRVPIKKQYWKYMGIKWFGFIFIFTSLQMGLGSACAIYQRFADAVLWIINTHSGTLFVGIGGLPLLYHYLDDFFGGHYDNDTAKLQVFAVYFWFWLLGIPTRWDKIKWPHWIQIILGWQYHTRFRTVSLPAQKRIAYKNRITKLIRERFKGTNKKQLEQINGCLEHASVAVYPGKAKNRNIQRAMHLDLYNYDDKIILSDLVIQDLKWWLFALDHMNGIPLKWVFSCPDQYHDQFWTDAALKGDLKIGGMGGCTQSGIAYQIDNRQTLAYFVSKHRAGVDIKFMEMLASYILFAYMAPKWQYKNIKCFCDNDTVVRALIKKRSPLVRYDMHHLLDLICKLSVQYHFRFWVEYIKGTDNVMADSLSRFKTSYTDGTEIDMNNIRFISHKSIEQIVNPIFVDLLNFDVVPCNVKDS